MQIRPIARHEIDAAFEAVASSGLGTTRDQLTLCVEIEPSQYIAAWEDGRAVGTVGAVVYEGFAFIGAMAVRADCQGHGIGKALFQRLLAQLEEAGVSLLGLEATDKGFPLYRSFGFVEHSRTVSYLRAPEHRSDLDCQLARDMVVPLGNEHIDEVIELDSRVVGANRRKLLEPLIARQAGRGFVVYGGAGQLEGYALAAPTRIGPWVATNAAAAEALLDAALTLPYDKEPTVALPGPNSAGAALLLRAGFDAQRSTRRMWRGAQPPHDTPELLYGLASMGLG